jgi:hypothetical protein
VKGHSPSSRADSSPRASCPVLPAGARFVERFRTRPCGHVEKTAVHAAQAAGVLLDAIARSDGTRGSVIEQLFQTRVYDGLLGTFRFRRLRRRRPQPRHGSARARRRTVKDDPELRGRHDRARSPALAEPRRGTTAGLTLHRTRRPPTPHDPALPPPVNENRACHSQGGLSETGQSALGPHSCCPVRASTVAAPSLTLATDEWRESRGPVGSRLLRSRSGSASRQITRAYSRVESGSCAPSSGRVSRPDVANARRRWVASIACLGHTPQ